MTSLAVNFKSGDDEIVHVISCGCHNQAPAPIYIK